MDNVCRNYRHNRYCDDTVGIKIKVPVSQEVLTMDYDTWPNEVSCQRWEPYHDRTQDGYDRGSNGNYHKF